MGYISDAETGGSRPGVNAHDRNRYPSLVQSVSVAESGTAETESELESGRPRRASF